MKPPVRSSTVLGLVVAALATVVTSEARAQTFAPDTANDSAPHPAAALGVGDVVLGGAMIPLGFGVGALVNDNGWEKASSIVGAGLGLGALGAAATAHGLADQGRKLKDPTAAGFGWFFTSLSAGGVGAGVGLLIGGEEAGKPVGGVIAATSLIFLAPGIPLIADGERTAVSEVQAPPGTQTWSVPKPSADGGWVEPQSLPPANGGWVQPQSVPAPDGGWVPPSPPPTELNSPAMVGVGTTFIVLGGLGSILGLSGVAIGADIGEEGVTALGGGILAASLGTALAIGLPLVVVGARQVPVAPTLSVGPGGVGLSGSF